jgi:16S rRNA (uracil1498-N3)-methyltransferase
MSEGMGRTRKLIEGITSGDKVAVFIGPEGGFDESEIELAKEAGFEIITLGKRILRTETAGFTVMSWIMYQMEADD